jgi:hypothetical protein
MSHFHPALHLPDQPYAGMTVLYIEAGSLTATR